MGRSNKNKNSNNSISTVKTLQDDVDDIRQKQEEQNAGLYEKLEEIHDILEKQGELFEMFEKMQKTKNVEIPIPAPEKLAVFNSCKEKSSTPTSGKEFVLRHVFNNVSSMKEGEDKCSKIEDHFGVPWKIGVVRENKHFGFYFYCLRDRNENEEWTIELWRDMRICSKSGKVCSKPCETIFRSTDKRSGRGWDDFLRWDEFMKDYVTDNSITAELHIKINRMSGVYKENLRSFDVDAKKFSDVVLVVGEKRFYVSKLFLARHSSYFEALFLGQFQESQKAEISLSGIDPDDFQNYLEVLYGDPAIDEVNVEGILVVADMYDTQIVIGKCEDFLMNESEKSMKKKLELAARYNLDKLKKKCLSEIKTVDEFKAVIPGNLRDMDPSILADLLEKSLSLH